MVIIKKSGRREKEKRKGRKKLGKEPSFTGAGNMSGTRGQTAVIPGGVCAKEKTAAKKRSGVKSKTKSNEPKSGERIALS